MSRIINKNRIFEELAEEYDINKKEIKRLIEDHENGIKQEVGRMDSFVAIRICGLGRLWPKMNRVKKGIQDGTYTKDTD